MEDLQFNSQSFKDKPDSVANMQRPLVKSQTLSLENKAPMRVDRQRNDKGQILFKNRSVSQGKYPQPAPRQKLGASTIALLLPCDVTSQVEFIATEKRKGLTLERVVEEEERKIQEIEGRRRARDQVEELHTMDPLLQKLFEHEEERRLALRLAEVLEPVEPASVKQHASAGTQRARIPFSRGPQERTRQGPPSPTSPPKAHTPGVLLFQPRNSKPSAEKPGVKNATSPRSAPNTPSPNRDSLTNRTSTPPLNSRSSIGQGKSAVRLRQDNSFKTHRTRSMDEPTDRAGSNDSADRPGAAAGFEQERLGFMITPVRSMRIQESLRLSRSVLGGQLPREGSGGSEGLDKESAPGSYQFSSASSLSATPSFKSQRSGKEEEMTVEEFVLKSGPDPFAEAGVDMSTPRAFAQGDGFFDPRSEMASDRKSRQLEATNSKGNVRSSRSDSRSSCSGSARGSIFDQDALEPVRRSSVRPEHSTSLHRLANQQSARQHPTISQSDSLNDPYKHYVPLNPASEQSQDQITPDQSDSKIPQVVRMPPWNSYLNCLLSSFSDRSAPLRPTSSLMGSVDIGGISQMRSRTAPASSSTDYPTYPGVDASSLVWRQGYQALTEAELRALIEKSKGEPYENLQSALKLLVTEEPSGADVRVSFDQSPGRRPQQKEHEQDPSRTTPQSGMKRSSRLDPVSTSWPTTPATDQGRSPSRGPYTHDDPSYATSHPAHRSPRSSDSSTCLPPLHVSGVGFTRPSFNNMFGFGMEGGEGQSGFEYGASLMNHTWPVTPGNGSPRPVSFGTSRTNSPCPTPLMGQGRTPHAFVMPPASLCKSKRTWFDPATGTTVR